MISLRFHGRGGQGVVTAAELCAIAAFKAGLFSQAIPFFGVERSGAPIQSFARIDKSPIRLREHIYEPNVIVVQDESLLASTDILFGADAKTLIVINSEKTAGTLAKEISADKIQSFKPLAKNIIPAPATKIALEIFQKNIVNTTLLGALINKIPGITLESLEAAIKEKFGDKGETIISKNIVAIKKVAETK